MTEQVAHNLGSKIAKGVMVIVGGGVVMRLVALANTLIVARILTQEDFGLIAIGMVMMQLLENFTHLSIERTIIKFRTVSDGVLRTLLTLSAIKGVLVALLMIIAAPIASAFYGDPRLAMIFVALGVAALIRSLRNPKFYEFERDLDFSKELIVAGIAKVVSVVASISIALIFRTYWAIIAGVLVAVSLEVSLSYVWRPFRPGISFDGFRKVMSFTGWTTAAASMTALNNKLGPLILGRILGTGPTGTYYVGSQLSGILGRELAFPIVKALYPGLASLQDDPSKMRKAYLTGVEAMAIIVAPAAFGLAFVAQDAVTLLLGDKWPGAAKVVSIFTPVYGFVSVLSGVQALAMASGRVRSLFFREFFFFLIQVPLLIMCSMRWGFDGALWSTATSVIIYIGLQSRLYALSTDDAWWRPLWAARRGLLALLPMCGWFLFARPHLNEIENLHIFLRLMVDVFCGAGLYLVTLIGIWLASGKPDGLERHAFLFLQKRTSS